MLAHRAFAVFVPTLALGPLLARDAIHPPKPDEPQPACEADAPSADSVLKVGVYDGLVVLPGKADFVVRPARPEWKNAAKLPDHDE